MSPTRQPCWGDLSLAGTWYSHLQCVGASFTLLAKTPEIQRDGLLFCVYEFRGLKLQGSFCLVLIFHQSTSLKLCTFYFLMVLQRNWMLWKKVDNALSLYLQPRQFSFCLPVWFFPDGMMLKWVKIKGRCNSNAEMFPHLSHITLQIWKL